MQTRPLILLFFLALLLIACTEEAPAPKPAAPLPTAESTLPAKPTSTQTAVLPTETVAETAVSTPSPSAAPETGTWPSPLPPYDAFSRAPVTPAEQLATEKFVSDLPPERDDIELATAYRGVTLSTITPPLVEEPLRIGTRQNLFVNNIDVNTTSDPIFELRYVSDHAYFWFDTTPGLSEPTAEQLTSMGEGFDQIYELSIYYFGPENNPGVDGDPRVHIVNASPLSICDVTEANANFCGLLGYVATSNTLPVEVYPTSNQREMFVMNGAYFGTSTYLDTLGHEFRHMIEDRYDVNDWDWEVEGSAVLAEDLLGFPEGPISRGNLFLANPDQQLNRWTDGNSIPYYGQGYVLNRYIFNRLGERLYREFATSPLPGFLAIDAVAEQNNLAFTGLDLWVDWLAALAIHNNPNAPDIYRLREGLDTAAFSTIDSVPYGLTTTVNQFAADYYRFSSQETVTVQFTGSNHVPVLTVQPLSGAHMWVANRANYSQMRLTQTFDLSDVETATLEYAVFHDIEEGYDFAYVSISTDGGRTWRGLVSEHMQGEAARDDPSDVAYTDRFYTGRGQGWVSETADLTPYAGQPVQIRFEYITDPILTFGGLGIDNIAIPEIGYFDNAEADGAWVAEGFIRTTGYLAQPWHLILITYADGVPIVERISVDAANQASFTVALGASGGERPFLIVAASAPMTLQSATYQLTIE